MKKSLILIMTFVLMTAMVGAGFSAFFSDSETRTDNNITAGYLRLANYQDGSPFHLNYHLAVGNNNFKPGQSETHSYRLENEGTVDGILWVSIPWWESIENGRQEREALAGDTSDVAGELHNVVAIKLEADLDCDGTMDFTLMDKWVKNIGTTAYQVGEIKGNAVGTTSNYNKVCMDLTTYWPETGTDTEDNKALTDAINFDLKFELRQRTTGNQNY